MKLILVLKPTVLKKLNKSIDNIDKITYNSNNNAAVV